MDYRLHKTSSGYELHNGPDNTKNIGNAALAITAVTLLLSIVFNREGSLDSVISGNIAMTVLFTLNMVSLVAAIVSFIILLYKHSSTRIAKLPDASEYSLLANIEGKDDEVSHILEHLAGIYLSDLTKKEKKTEERKYRLTIPSLLGR